MKRIIRYAILLGLAAVTTVAQAALPPWYPDNFSKVGIVDRVDFERRVMVIDDASLHLASDVMLHSLSSQGDSLGRLRSGARVGLRLNGRHVMEIWLLPTYYEPQESPD